MGKASGTLLRTKYIKYTSRVIRKYDILYYYYMAAVGNGRGFVGGVASIERGKAIMVYPFLLSTIPSTD
jgi:hypothetical protein